VLNGFMRVGPAFYPERRRGAQIIQRGPHGHRFSADPVLSRLGQPRGSGFRWWKEQMDAGGDYDGFWDPRQVVEGVMGLGAAPDITQVMDCPEGAPPLPAFPVPSPTDPARAVYAELQRAVGAACRGRIDAAHKFATEGVSFFLKAVPAGKRAEWERHQQTALDYITRASGGAVARKATQEERERAFGQAMARWNRENAEAGRRQAAAEVAAARRGQAAYAAHLYRTDPAGSAQASVTGRPPAGWRSGASAELRAERAARGECVGIDPSCWVENHWWKAALVLGGVALLYGFGSGAARRAF
jgi:hypothetical protein